MRILYKQLKKLPVVTEMGEELGNVHDLVLDIDTHSIVHYEVSPSLLSTKKYSISPSQVVSITQEKMVVQDAVVFQKEQDRGLNQLWTDTRLTSQDSLQETSGE